MVWDHTSNITTLNHSKDVIAATLIYSTEDTELASDEVAPSKDGKTPVYCVADDTCEIEGKSADVHPWEAPKRRSNRRNTSLRL